MAYLNLGNYRRPQVGSVLVVEVVYEDLKYRALCWKEWAFMSYKTRENCLLQSKHLLSSLKGAVMGKFSFFFFNCSRNKDKRTQNDATRNRGLLRFFFFFVRLKELGPSSKTLTTVMTGGFAQAPMRGLQTRTQHLRRLWWRQA